MGYGVRSCKINRMANEWDENKSAEEPASAAGMVEAVTQDAELIIDKVMDSAGNAVVAVQEKLGLRKPAPKRAKKPAKKARAIKAGARTVKAKARTAKAKVSKVVKSKARKAGKVAKSAKAKVSKAKKAKRR